MPTALDNMLSAAAGILAGYHGVSVTLKVGRNQSDPFDAVFDLQEIVSIEADTRREIKLMSRDYFLPAAALIVNGSTIVPKAGMIIVEGSTEYEILPNSGKPAAELQPDGTYLVHTKQSS